MNILFKELQALKKKQDAVIMAHYYASPEVQDVADYIGDSFYLATLARTIKNKTIVLAGVYFMAESAKLLCPEKTILLPDETAGCPMADMATAEDVCRVRKEYEKKGEDLAVVCYVNSNAELKAVSDVCVTSSNAVAIVDALVEKNIYFVPDNNLAYYISTRLPNKNFIFHKGFCCVHEGITTTEIENAKALHPNAKILMHPECNPSVLKYADYIGATSGILDFVLNSDDDEFIIATELGIIHQMKKLRPNKKFYHINETQVCKSMKKNTLESITNCLKNGKHEIELNIEMSKQAKHPLERMVELARVAK
jgi:quinolinate synthase